MNSENLLEEADLEKKWDIECPEFPNRIFSYKKWEFKMIGYLSEAEHVSKFRYKPNLLSFYSPENKPTKYYISVKKLTLPTDERKARNILYEIKSLMMLGKKKMNEQDSNIIRLYGFLRENGYYLLYMEWMDFSLKDFYMNVKNMLIRRTVSEEIRSKLNILIGN